MIHIRKGQIGLIGIGINILVYFLVCVWSVELVDIISLLLICIVLYTMQFVPVQQQTRL